MAGIVRNMDDLGRIVIPSEWRRDLILEPGKLAEITKNKDMLVIRLLSEGEEPNGIDKKIDGLGRVVIPSEWRKELGITKETPIEMMKSKNKIHLKVKEDVCCICRSKPKENTVTLKLHNKIICGTCKKQINQN